MRRIAQFTARGGRESSCASDLHAPKNIENNPMQSSRRPAWIPRKQVDTSGKSLAFLHHPAILKTPVDPQQRGAPVAIAVQNPLPPLKLHRLAAANDRLRVAARFRRACLGISI